MGFWSTLGRGLGIAGAGIATGLTGGAAAPLLGTALSVGGTVAGGIANSLANNRGEQDQQNLSRDQLALIAARDQDRAGLERADLQLRENADQRRGQTESFQQALRAALALNSTDNQVDTSQFRTQGVPSISFGQGVRSSIGPQGQAAASALERNAMLRLMNGEPRTSVPEYAGPSLSEPSRAGFWENLLGGVSLGADVAGQFSGARGAAPTPEGLDPALRTPLNSPFSQAAPSPRPNPFGGR